MSPTRRATLAATASLVPMGGCAWSSLPGSTSDGGAGGDARIGLAGDVMLGRGVDERHADRRPESVWGTLLPDLRRLDGTLANLECCISERGTRWPGKGYYFRTGGWALPALDVAGIGAVSLANNHTLDFGPSALRDTLAGLERTGIGSSGAGTDRRAALEPAIIDVGEVSVAILALTDRMPAFAAGPRRPGTARMGLGERSWRARRLVRDVLRRPAVDRADLVVASLHWGPNWTLVKHPARRAFGRWLVDAGVDVVHGHSAHVPHGIEVYEGAPILYDCGDLVDDYLVKEGLHNDRSFLFELVVEAGSVVAVRLHPVEIRRSTAHRATGDVARWLFERMRTLSSRFDTAVRVESGTGALRVSVTEG
ncbi:CapA family protein [Haloglomus halophilum]|uniref:CapA family protein n=1 Tax=Haloglomus halophilum TaxID=2962672 RepID=UPI0020C965FF|nr:CapA family protein [Haloglomus halophilum]